MNRLLYGALVVLYVLPSTAFASCEYGIGFRSTDFELSCYGIMPYVDAADDSSLRELYDRHALCLAHAIQIHRCERAREPIAAARRAGGRIPVRLWEGPWGQGQCGLVRYVDRRWVSDDALLEVVRSCLMDEFATLFTVEVARFPAGVDPRRALTTLAGLTGEYKATLDTTAAVDWLIDTCGGSFRPSLFFLATSDRPGSECPLYYGLFVEESQAAAAGDRLRRRYSLPEVRVTAASHGPRAAARARRVASSLSLGSSRAAVVCAR